MEKATVVAGLLFNPVRAFVVEVEDVGDPPIKNCPISGWIPGFRMEVGGDDDNFGLEPIMASFVGDLHEVAIKELEEEIPGEKLTGLAAILIEEDFFFPFVLVKPPAPSLWRGH